MTGNGDRDLNHRSQVRDVAVIGAVMSDSKKWDGLAARVYYTLGAAHYLKLELASVGILTLLGSLAPFRYAFLLAIVGVSLIGVATYLGIASVKRRLQGTNPGLKILTVEETFVVLGNNRYDSKRNVLLRAIRDGVDAYIDKLIWTGSGTMNLEVESPRGATGVLDRERLGTYEVTRIVFDRPLRRGERATVRFTLHLWDEQGTCQPFLSVRPNDPIHEHLIMRVRFEEKPAVSNRKQILLSDVSEIPVYENGSSSKKGSREVYWKVRKPRPTFRYRITWNEGVEAQENTSSD